MLARAVLGRRVLLTFDKDFGELAWRRGLPADCGIVLFRAVMPDRWNDTFDTEASIYGVVELNTVNAYDYSYGYKIVFDSNADQFVVNATSVRKYTYPYSSPPPLF